MRLSGLVMSPGNSHRPPRLLLHKSGSALFGFRRVHKGLLGGRGGSVFQALQFLAGLKANGFTGRDAHFFAGAGIPADAGFARLDAEYAELAKFDALAAAKGILERFEHGLDRLLRLRPADIRFGDHRVYNVQLNHTTLQESVARCYWLPCGLSRRGASSTLNLLRARVFRDVPTYTVGMDVR